MGTTRYYDTTGNLVMLGRVDTAGGTLDAGALTVQEAHSLDLKVDDGLPDSGSVFVGRGSGLGSNNCTDGESPIGNFTQSNASFRFADTAETCVMAFWVNKD
jgi:hypothetical protein